MRKIAAFLLILFFVSCAGKTEVSIPEHVLSKEKMTEVLVDVHLLEAAMNLNINPVTAGTMNINTGSDIFKKNNISKSQYDESMAFYSEHPQLLNAIYQDVLNSLSRMQAEVTNSK